MQGHRRKVNNDTKHNISFVFLALPSAEYVKLFESFTTGRYKSHPSPILFISISKKTRTLSFTYEHERKVWMRMIHVAQQTVVKYKMITKTKAINEENIKKKIK